MSWFHLPKPGCRASPSTLGCCADWRKHLKMVPCWAVPDNLGKIRVSSPSESLPGLTQSWEWEGQECTDAIQTASCRL